MNHQQTLMSPQLIVALDFPTQTMAWDLVDKLDPKQCAVKVGLEMFTLFGSQFVKALVEKEFKVFLDLKFHDIPNTVASACRACAHLGVWMLNVHASGGPAMMLAAKEALQAFGEEKPLLIAVTILTSMGEEEFHSIGFRQTLSDQVLDLAMLTHESGLDGVVCSALEASIIKSNCGKNFITVTPGIRLEESSSDDQVRVITPEKAIASGSDFLVVGRPITRAPNPEQVVERILKKIKP